MREIHMKFGGEKLEGRGNLADLSENWRLILKKSSEMGLESLHECDADQNRIQMWILWAQ
jgi:hypothetical protein